MAQGRTKDSSFAIMEKNLGSVGRGQSFTFDEETIAIPSLPPSNLEHCRIIDLDYFLEVRALQTKSFSTFYFLNISGYSLHKGVSQQH
jgi:hypothetical protein